jgi:hypothetical protein
MRLRTAPAIKVPPGGGTQAGSYFSTIWLGRNVFSEVKKFVVIRQGHRNSLCSYVVGFAYMMLEIN